MHKIDSYVAEMKIQKKELLSLKSGKYVQYNDVYIFTYSHKSNHLGYGLGFVFD